MNRNRIIAGIAAVPVLLGLAAVPVIQAAWPEQAAPAPATLAPPQASGYSGPVNSWSAYQPIEGLQPAAAQPAAEPVNLAPPQASGYSGPIDSWSAYQPITAGQPTPTPAPQSSTKVIEFDVAEDMTRFIFDKDVVYEDGLPADGSAFITRGYLYKPGTLNGSNGVIVTRDANNNVVKVEPQFPDKVIGEWICQGYMINAAGHAKEGVWVFSTQFFQFGDKPGAKTLVSQGYELADVGVAISRAITGGTGQYKDARGEGEQTLLGLNQSEGVNLHVKLKVRTN